MPFSFSAPNTVLDRPRNQKTMLWQHKYTNHPLLFVLVILNNELRWSRWCTFVFHIAHIVCGCRQIPLYFCQTFLFIAYSLSCFSLIVQWEKAGEKKACLTLVCPGASRSVVGRSSTSDVGRSYPGDMTPAFTVRPSKDWGTVSHTSTHTGFVSLWCQDIKR